MTNWYPIALRALALPLLCMLSGCKRYSDWGNKNFQQAGTLTNPRDLVAESCVRRRVYDHFNTLLLIDALWLNNHVLTTRSELMARTNLWPAQQAADYYDDLMREHAAKTAFYVLVGPDICNDLPIFSSTQQARWTPTLRIDGIEYQPSDIVTNTRDTLYNRMLSVKSANFRTPYIINFPVVTTPDQRIELVLRSYTHELVLTWNE